MRLPLPHLLSRSSLLLPPHRPISFHCPLLSPAFSSSLPHTPSNSGEREGAALRVLHLTAGHSPSSLVSVGAQAVLGGITRPLHIERLDLWASPLPQYSVEHARAKLAILGGSPSQEEMEKFGPVQSAAEEVNRMDVVVIATPMWNYSAPYPLKQWIDTVVQPGINFSDSGELQHQGGRWAPPSHSSPPSPPLLPLFLHHSPRERALVVVSSAGGRYGEGEHIQDFLNPYLRQVFSLLGFRRHFEIFIQGTSTRERQECLEWTLREAGVVAAHLSSL